MIKCCVSIWKNLYYLLIETIYELDNIISLYAKLQNSGPRFLVLTGDELFWKLLAKVTSIRRYSVNEISFTPVYNF